MTQSAEVISVSEDKKEAQVCPIVTDACLSCKEGCARRGNPFAAANPQGFDLKAGDLVRITASQAAESLQAIFSLLLPAACAVAAFFAASPISRALFQRESTEGFKALCVLIGILVPGAAVMALSRFKIRPSKPNIDKVY
ncbi:MAG: SoxR reducing system RseC family protein [Treponema sp.]|nr:SoxR reducing system RseC family protein [Treponema sp.]